MLKRWLYKYILISVSDFSFLLYDPRIPTVYNTRYVSCKGSDIIGDGSITKPYRYLSTAISSCPPYGSVIILDDRIYRNIPAYKINKVLCDPVEAIICAFSRRVL